MNPSAAIEVLRVFQPTELAGKLCLSHTAVVDAESLILADFAIVEPFGKGHHERCRNAKLV